MMIPPPTDDTTTIPAPLLAAYERLWTEVGREPIGRVHKETTQAWEAVRRLRATRKRRRRSDAK